MLAKLKLPPGILGVGTRHDSQGRWRDGSLVRWNEGILQPVRPWSRITPIPLTGRICGMQPVLDNDQRKWLIIGSNEGVWVLGEGEAVDVTPAAFSAGYIVTEIAAGFGVGLYNTGDYGTPRSVPTGLSLEADNWSFDVWGEYVVGCSVGDGTALVWRPGTLSSPYDPEFLPIDNAPINNRALVVTTERHLLLVSAGGNPRKIQWSAREDYTEWTPSALNQAGDLELETAGSLQAAIKMVGGVVVLSEVDAFMVRFVGQPYGYGQTRIGHNCGIIGPHAGTSASDFAVWMGPTGFWMYQGQLHPVSCDVWDYVFRDIDYFQRAQVACGHNAEFSEVWWFFPKVGHPRNSHYVCWNYRENWWSVGVLGRSHWQTKGIWDHSVAAGHDGHVYEHEKLFSDPGAANRDAPYITSAPFEIGSGDQVMHITRLVPDQECRHTDALSYTFESRQAPVCGSATYGPYHPSPSGFTDTRFVGRELQWTVNVEDDVDWRLGVLRADIKPGGGR